MRLPGLPLLLLVALGAAVAGCEPHIGDACTLPSQCSATGSRLCEPNFPGGYCTIFNCEPGTCPSESVCVAFGTTPSTKKECRDVGTPRLERSFCMFACGSASDCRAGYDCVDLGQTDPTLNPWGAVVLERGAFNPKVCTLPLSGVTPSADDGSAPESSVCSPSANASFPWDTDAGSDGGGGAPAQGARDAALRDGAPNPGDASRDAQGAP